MAVRFAYFIRHPLRLPKITPPERVDQQFCGHAETTRPPGNVSVRMRPDGDLSRARLTSLIRTFPRFPSKSDLPPSRILNQDGDGPSADQLCIAPAAPFTSTVK